MCTLSYVKSIKVTKPNSQSTNHMVELKVLIFERLKYHKVQKWLVGKKQIINNNKQGSIDTVKNMVPLE